MNKEDDRGIGILFCAKSIFVDTGNQSIDNLLCKIERLFMPKMSTRCGSEKEDLWLVSPVRHAAEKWYLTYRSRI